MKILFFFLLAPFSLSNKINRRRAKYELLNLLQRCNRRWLLSTFSCSVARAEAIPSHARRGDSCSALTSAHLRSLKSHLKKPKCLFFKRNIHSTCCGIQSLEQARHHEVVSLLAEVCNSESLFLSNICQWFIFAWARGGGRYYLI